VFTEVETSSIKERKPSIRERRTLSLALFVLFIGSHNRCLPRTDVASPPHEGTQREPQTVEYREVVSEGRSSDAVLDLPFLRAEPTDEEKDDADGEIRQNDAHPDLVAQRIHEREDAWLLLLRFLDHDADAELHERLREVDHPFALRHYRQRRDRDVGFLRVVSNSGTHSRVSSS